MLVKKINSIIVIMPHTSRALIHVVSLSLSSPSPQKRVNREFETMFETGVDEMSWDDTVSDNTMVFQHATPQSHICTIVGLSVINNTCMRRDLADLIEE